MVYYLIVVSEEKKTRWEIAAARRAMPVGEHCITNSIVFWGFFLKDLP